MTVICPTPGKILYATRREARTSARTQKRSGLKAQSRPYLCLCGGWHLTSMTRRQARVVMKRRAA